MVSFIQRLLHPREKTKLWGGGPACRSDVRPSRFYGAPRYACRVCVHSWVVWKQKLTRPYLALELTKAKPRSLRLVLVCSACPVPSYESAVGKKVLTSGYVCWGCVAAVCALAIVFSARNLIYIATAGQLSRNESCQSRERVFGCTFQCSQQCKLHLWSWLCFKKNFVCVTPACYLIIVLIYVYVRVEKQKQYTTAYAEYRGKKSCG